MNTESLTRTMPDVPKMIDPATPAVIDYATVATLAGMGMYLQRRHPRAAALAWMNAGAVLGLSLMTDYPGGLFRKISFPMHGAVDAVQTSMSALGPALMGFASDPEATWFYSQAAVETGVIATTDCNA